MAVKNPPLQTQDESNQFVTLKNENGILVVCPDGPQLTTREASIINIEIVRELSHFREDIQYVVFDCSKLKIISSVGLMLFIEIRNTMHQRGGATILFGMNDDLMKLVKMVKVSRLFRIAQSERDLKKMTGRK